MPLRDRLNDISHWEGIFTQNKVGLHEYLQLSLGTAFLLPTQGYFAEKGKNTVYVFVCLNTISYPSAELLVCAGGGRGQRSTAAPAPRPAAHRACSGVHQQPRLVRISETGRPITRH